MAKVKRVLELPEELVLRLNATGIEYRRAKDVLDAIRDAGIDTTNEVSLNAIDKAAQEYAKADQANTEVWIEITALAKECGYNPAEGDSKLDLDARVAVCSAVFWYHDDGVAEG